MSCKRCEPGPLRGWPGLKPAHTPRPETRSTGKREADLADPAAAGSASCSRTGPGNGTSERRDVLHVDNDTLTQG